jgi:hypothetical protein
MTCVECDVTYSVMSHSCDIGFLTRLCDVMCVECDGGVRPYPAARWRCDRDGLGVVCRHPEESLVPPVRQSHDHQCPTAEVCTVTVIDIM